MSGPWIVAFVVLAVANLVTITILVGLVRRVLPVVERASLGPSDADPLPFPRPGTTVPAFVGRADDGRVVASDEVFAEPAVLLFVDAGCEPCRALLGELRSSPPRLSAAALYVVTRGGDGHADLPSGPRVRVLFQDGSEITDSVGMGGVPSAVAVYAGGTVVAADIIGGADRLQELIDRVERSAVAPG